MKSSYQQLANGIPAQSAPMRGSMFAGSKGLPDWLNGLPLANGLAAARLLLPALQDMNAVKLDGAQRLAGLELLRAAISQMVAQADRQVVGSSFPLPQARQQLGLQSREFHQLLALGYRIAAVELCAPEGKIPFLRGKPVATALQRAIAHHGEQLLRGYLLYTEPQPAVWQRLHDLYRFAQSVGVHDKAIEDPLLAKVASTVAESYAHIMLLALSNPFRLSQKEMFDAFGLTRVWAPHCRIEKGHGASDVGLSMDEDRGPGYVPEERDFTSAPAFSFETADVLRSIERDLALTASLQGPISFRRKGGAAVTVTPEFVRRLTATWKPAADRNHARLPAGHYLDTLVGLHAIHYYLANSTDFEQFVRDLRGPGISMTERDKSASWVNAGGESVRPVALRSKVLDQGLGGYRLEWGVESGAKARIGELIGLAAVGGDDDAEREWMIGSIRWLRFTGDGRVQAGIELLAREAAAAAVRAADTGGHFRAPVRAIELQPMHDANHNQLSILTPSVVDRGLLRIELSRAADPWADSREALVHVMNEIDVVENTGAYVRLVPRIANAADQEAAAA